MAGAGYAEEASHGTRGSNAGSGGGASASVDNTPERPDWSGSVARAVNTVPVPAGRIMSPKELSRAGLKPDDVVHVSVF
jgi:hypothetical protein